MRVHHEIMEPEKPERVADNHRRVAKVLNGGVHFGEPIHPEGFANGQVDNMDGSWVLKLIDDTEFLVPGIQAGAAITFQHNLGVPVFTGYRNVYWFTCGVASVMTLGAGGPITLVYRGGTMTADAIDLWAVSYPLAPVPNATVPVFFMAGRW